MFIFTDAVHMCEEDIYKQNIAIKVQLANWDKKFQEASAILNRLREKYVASREYGTFRRYRRLKKMIEEVLENDLDPRQFYFM